MSVSFSTTIQRAKVAPNAQTSAAMRECLGKLPLTSYSTLGNGFRVACEENPHAQFATVGVWMDIGSKWETKGKNRGAAKLLELVGLQGTTNQSRSQLAKAVDEIGGQLHTETGVEHSKVYIKCHKDHVPKAITLMSDLIQNANLSDEAISAAKTELNAQREAKEEDPEFITRENMRMIAYDSTDSGLGNTVCALVSETTKLTAAELSEFRSAHYGAGRMVLVGAGAVNHTQLEKLAQDNFGKLPNTPKPVYEPRFIGGDMKLWNIRSYLAHNAWAFETPGARSADNIPLNLVSHIFGKFERSQNDLAQHAMHRVFKTFSAMDNCVPSQKEWNEKAIEQAYFFNEQYEDTGLAGHFFTSRNLESEPGHTALLLWSSSQYSFMETNRLAQRGMTEAELEWAKVNYKSQVLFNQDGSTNTANEIGRQVLHHDRRVTADEMFNRIDDCTRTNIQETLQHYYTHRKVVSSWYGYLPYTPNITEYNLWNGKMMTAY